MKKILFVVLLCLVSMPAFAKDKSVYDRVINSGTLRCGYAFWPGLMEQDPNTKTLSGLFYDYMEEMAKILEIKVEWTEELAYGDLPEALRTSRVDAFCAGAWTNPIRGKYADPLVPIVYQSVTAFKRAGDNRFDNDLASMNKPEVKISVIDGESTSVIARRYFPNATIQSLPQGTDGTQMLLNVITKKADIGLADAIMLKTVQDNNPGKLREVKLKYPLQVYGTTIWIKKGEPELKATLDNATQQLISDGTIDRLLTKHETAPGMYLRPQVPYQGYSHAAE
ncbi:MAG: transporter substrate-binding domain-containing protein [Alphaproteobacteria bacterium]|nr:transporter substrate-binding domain-containing protein [Alphaproteobacteria bacterium]